MAVRFDTANDRLLATTGLPTGATWTITLWLYISVDRNDYSSFASINNSPAPPVAWLNTVSNGTSLGFDTQGGAMASTYPATAGAWFRYGVAVEPGGTVRMYAGAATGGLTAYTADMATRIPTSPAQLWIGSAYDGSWFNGRVAAFKLWNVALSAAEVETEFTQYAVARTADLIRSHPFIDSTADTSGNGHTFTAESSPVSWEAGPDIPLGGSVEIAVDSARAVTRAGAPLLTQTHPITVAAARSATRSDSPQLVQTSDLTIAATRAATRTAPVTLAQHTQLLVDGAHAATRTTRPLLTTAGALLVHAARATTRATAPLLAQRSLLHVPGTRAATHAGNPTVRQQHPLTVHPARAATRAETPLLSVPGMLIVHAARAVTSTIQPLLAQSSTLLVHAARAATRAPRVLFGTAPGRPVATPTSVLLAPAAVTVQTHPTSSQVDTAATAGTVHTDEARGAALITF